MGMPQGLMHGVRGLLTVLLWIGAVVAVLILIVAGLFTYGRLRGPDAAGRAALAVLQAPRAMPPGRNAFPILWLVRWPVPDDQLQAVTATDVRALLAAAAPMFAAFAVPARRIPYPVSITQTR